MPFVTSLPFFRKWKRKESLNSIMLPKLESVPRSVCSAGGGVGRILLAMPKEMHWRWFTSQESSQEPVRKGSE